MESHTIKFKGFAHDIGLCLGMLCLAYQGRVHAELRTCLNPMQGCAWEPTICT